VARIVALLVLLGLVELVAFAPLRAQGTAAGAQTQPADVVIDAPEPFGVWLDKLMAEARTRGFSERLIQQTLVGLEPMPQVVRSDRNQAELNPGFAKYLSSHLPPILIRNGRDMLQQHASLLRAIEAKYGVPGPLVAAIWGIETRYGRVTGRTPVFRALATLAWEPRRADFFRGELFQALMMVDRGYIDAPSMSGSWAGAMGQAQFMPSSYMAYAVDYDGDGHRDIWRSTPDALASIANYLKGYGWAARQSWGREVRVPPEAQTWVSTYVPRRSQGCYAIRNMTERLPMSTWRNMGVTDVDGSLVPAADMVAGLVDVGERKFLVYPNYDAILGYNCAHYYALTAAILAEHLGPAASQAPRIGNETGSTSASSGRTRSTRTPAKRKTPRKGTRPRAR
jgi:membrane-bound lytic murein transglycosylase B